MVLVEPGITQLGRRPLDLDGWSDRSVWGWDGQAGSLFAQLWRDRADEDADEDDSPEFWITPPSWEATAQLAMLASRIAETTGNSISVVLDALAQSAPGQVRDVLMAEVKASGV